MIWLCDKETPQLKDTGKLQNSFDIWIGKIMTKFISRYHCTSHQFSKTVPTVHNFSIWFLTVKSGLCFFKITKLGNKWPKITFTKKIAPHRFDVQSSIYLSRSTIAKQAHQKMTKWFHWTWGLGWNLPNWIACAALREFKGKSDSLALWMKWYIIKDSQKNFTVLH